MYPSKVGYYNLILYLFVGGVPLTQNKRILILEGEDKLKSNLKSFEHLKKNFSKQFPRLNNVEFHFSDGIALDTCNLSEYALIALVSSPNKIILEILQKAESKGITTVNNSEILLKYNDCLQTQCLLKRWGYFIPQLGVPGLNKIRYHDARKYDNNSLSSINFTSQTTNSLNEYYKEQFIKGTLFKVKVLGYTTFYIVECITTENGKIMRIDRTSYKKYSWLGKLGITIAETIGAELISIDFIIEENTEIPYCIDINFGNTLNGVQDGFPNLLNYFAKRVNDPASVGRINAHSSSDIQKYLKMNV